MIVGAEDPATPPAAAEAIHRQIAGSTLIVMPAVAHMLCAEDPARSTSTCWSSWTSRPARSAGNKGTSLKRVLVLGGYGAFGGRVAERLARAPGIEVVIAGRSLRPGARAALALEIATGKPYQRGACRRARCRRPFLPASAQRGDQRLGTVPGAGLWPGASLHRSAACTISISRTRGRFVTGIRVLDAEARSAGVLAVSGASTVPALSGAVVDAYAPQFASLSTSRP